MSGVPIPVLLYHAIGTERSSWIAPFTVSAATFARHLELIANSGRTGLTVDELHQALTADTPLPASPVVITFDDGFAEVAEVAAPLLAKWRLPATIFLTTGYLDGRSPGGDRMLSWAAARELLAEGFEIGAHSVSHPQLDTLPIAAARHEIVCSGRELEDRLDAPIRSFAYPHGYSSPAVRRLVREAGYESACAVHNAFSHVDDRTHAIARLTVTADTTDEQLERWLAGEGARIAGSRDRAATRAWRCARRLRTHRPTWRVRS